MFPTSFAFASRNFATDWNTLSATTPTVNQVKTLRSSRISVVTFPCVSLKLLKPRLPIFPMPTIRSAKAKETRFKDISRKRYVIDVLEVMALAREIENKTRPSCAVCVARL